MTQPVALVTKREITERLRAKSFLVSTGIYLAVSLATVVIPHFTGGGKTVYGVGVAGEYAPALETAIKDLAPTAKVEVETLQYPDGVAAEAAVRDKLVRVAVVDASRLLARGDDTPPSLELLLNTAAAQVKLLDRLRAAGLSQSQVAGVLGLDQLRVERVATAGGGAAARPLRTSNKPLAFAGILVIYLLLLTYGFTVANGVLEEKSSRVSEILLGALRPAQLLGGKIVGIGVVAVVQLALIGIPSALVALALGSLHVPSGTPLTLAAVIMWALLGYGLYSCVFAAAGAAASRPEDVGNATAPITILIAATYFTAVASVQNPDGTLARVVSFIPPMAPMTMLPRAAIGHVQPWEVPLSIALVLLTTYATVRLGARVYAGGIRRPGPRLKLREAWRAAAG